MHVGKNNFGVGTKSKEIFLPYYSDTHTHACMHTHTHTLTSDVSGGFALESYKYSGSFAVNN